MKRLATVLFAFWAVLLGFQVAVRGTSDPCTYTAAVWIPCVIWDSCEDHPVTDCPATVYEPHTGPFDCGDLPQDPQYRYDCEVETNAFTGELVYMPCYDTTTCVIDLTSATCSSAMSDLYEYPAFGDHACP